MGDPQRLNGPWKHGRAPNVPWRRTGSCQLIASWKGQRPFGSALFCGEAQIEDWEYALSFAEDSSQVLDLLRGVDLHKVGHHGSRIATPGPCATCGRSREHASGR